MYRLLLTVSFTFAVYRTWVILDGLTEQYQINPQFQLWIQLAKSLQFLPPEFVIPVWQRLLRYPGPILRLQNAHVGPLIQRFIQYFEFFWLRQVDNWNHFANDGPRNTNIAEAWHSKLNRSFGHPHPALHVFLSWFQLEHYSQQRRIRQLRSGQPARAPDATYARLHQQILAAKANLQQDRSGWRTNHQPLGTPPRGTPCESVCRTPPGGTPCESVWGTPPRGAPCESVCRTPARGYHM